MRRILFASLILVGAALAAETGAELFQKALTAERAAGNLEEAIKLYQRVAKEFGSDRALAAKAIVQEARCYEKLGQNKAIQLYEQVAREYKDQPEPSAAASARLAALKVGERPAGPATMTQRKLPPRSYSDGRREVQLDDATGAVIVGDFAGKEKRVIFKPKAGDQIAGAVPSRDFSMVAMQMAKSDGTQRLAVIAADGSAYREIGDWSSCDFSWSWDSHYIFVCSDGPDGTRSLARVPVAGGETHTVRAAIPFVHRLSPDGRFIAFDTVADPARFGKVLVMPSGGGDPQLVSDGAKLIDWTSNGRYLILASARSGSEEALYLFPMQDGRTAGEPVFVRYGSCLYGRTALNGGLVCLSALPGGLGEVWLGVIDSSGHVANWKRLSLGAGNATPYGSTMPYGSAMPYGLAWSPDSAQINYTVRQDDSYVVRVRIIDSGEDREVYRSSRYAACIWAAERPELLCVPYDRQAAKEVFSVSIDSGRVERLGAFPGADRWWPFFCTADDRAIYFARNPGEELVRWELENQQLTTVERLTGWSIPGIAIPAPDVHWIGRRVKDTTEIRPLSGGEWRPLISLKPTHIALTPDGSWLIYHGLDSGKDALFRVATSGGRPQRIGTFPSVSRSMPVMTISPNGQRILARHNSDPESWLLENFEPKQTAAR